jgi:hypothetical protein
MLRLFLFLGIATATLASETLDTAVTAAQSFVAAMGHQITVVRSDPSPADVAESTIAYARAKIFYYSAFREAMPDHRLRDWQCALATSHGKIRGRV